MKFRAYRQAQDARGWPQADADPALCGRGDFCLRPAWSKHRLTMECWTAMKPAQRQKAAEACLWLPVASTSTSSDDALTIPTTLGDGKKPHQLNGAVPVLGVLSVRRRSSSGGCTSPNRQTSSQTAMLTLSRPI